MHAYNTLIYVDDSVPFSPGQKCPAMRGPTVQLNSNKVDRDIVKQ